MAYIGNSPDTIQRGRRFIYEFTATAGQTVFSGADDNNQTLDLLEANEQSVFLNGVRLIPTDDYTVSGDTLTLTSAASLNDFLVVETQAEVANISTYTRAESDARYVNYNGDIISGDLQITGNVSVASGNISLGDNDKVIFGAGNDLQIYHDGSHSYIDEQGTGSLQLRATNFNIKSAANETYIACVADGQVELNYDNTTRLATTNTGIDVTGTVTADGLSISTSAENVATFASTDTAARIVITDGTDTGYVNVSTGKVSLGQTLGLSANNLNIDSSGNVGIGTTSPSNQLHVNGTSDQLRLSDGVNGFDIRAGGSLIIKDDGTERMRIDSSGNLLVAKTSQDQDVLGAEIRGNGIAAFTANSSAPLRANRTSTEGAILRLQKDGADMGVLGNNGLNLTIDGGANKVGLNFRGTEIRPRDNGSDNDGGVDLGSASYRFRDLYLSGGAYIGGTGSANYLDDYEEGTWTPTFVDGTVTTNSSSGEYTKVGNSVFVNINLSLSGVSSLSTSDVGTLPFTPNEYTTMAVFPITGFEQLGAMLCAQPATNGRIQLYYVNNASGDNYVRITDAHLNEGSQISLRIAGVYTTNS